MPQDVNPKITWYRRWHEHWLHKPAHWVIFACAVFTASVLVGYSVQDTVHFIPPAQAQAGGTFAECDHQKSGWVWCADFEKLANCTVGTESQCWRDNGYTHLPPFYTRPNYLFRIVQGDDAAVGTGLVRANPQAGSTGAGYNSVSLPSRYSSVNYRFYAKFGKGRLSTPSGHGPALNGTGTKDVDGQTQECRMFGSIEFDPVKYYLYRTNSCFTDAGWPGPSYAVNIMPNQPNLPVLQNGTWHVWEVQFVADTTCTNPQSFYGCNGIIRMWIDEQLVMEYTNINHGGTTNGVRFDYLYEPRNYYHRASPLYANGSTDDIALDNFVVSTNGYIGRADQENSLGTPDPLSPYQNYIGLTSFVGHYPSDDCTPFGYLGTQGGQWRTAPTLQSGIVLPNGFPNNCGSDPDQALQATVSTASGGSGISWARYTDDAWNPTYVPPQYVIHGYIRLPSGNDYTNAPALFGFRGNGTNNYRNYVAATVQNGNWAFVQRHNNGAPAVVSTSATPISPNTWQEYEIVLYRDQTASLMVGRQRVFEKVALPYATPWLFGDTIIGSTGMVVGVLDFQGTPPFTAYYDDVSVASASFWSCDGWGISCPFGTDDDLTAPSRVSNLQAH